MVVHDKNRFLRPRFLLPTFKIQHGSTCTNTHKTTWHHLKICPQEGRMAMATNQLQDALRGNSELKSQVHAVCVCMCVCVCECPQSCIIDKSGGIWACVITHLLLYTCTHTHIQPPTNLRTQIHVGCLHVCMPTHTHSHAQPHTHTHTQVSILSEEMRRAASNRDAVQAAKDHMHTHTGVNIE
jgi:hypothetical protein